METIQLFIIRGLRHSERARASADSRASRTHAAQWRLMAGSEPLCRCVLRARRPRLARWERNTRDMGWVGSNALGGNK